MHDILCIIYFVLYLNNVIKHIPRRFHKLFLESAGCGELERKSALRVPENPNKMTPAPLKGAANAAPLRGKWTRSLRPVRCALQRAAGRR